jgi:DNA-binding NarL/FixJ family response regulator
MDKSVELLRISNVSFNYSSILPQSSGQLKPEFNMARILIADDHELVRQGIRRILQARPGWEICGEAKDGREAIQLSKGLNPDVVILDVSMPVLGGLVAADDILRMHPKIKILIFTIDESKSLRTLVQKCGASGIVLKSQASRDLVEALDQLLAGNTFFDPIEEAQPFAGFDKNDVRILGTNRDTLMVSRKPEPIQ